MTCQGELKGERERETEARKRTEQKVRNSSPALVRKYRWKDFTGPDDKKYISVKRECCLSFAGERETFVQQEIEKSSFDV